MTLAECARGKMTGNPSGNVAKYHGLLAAFEKAWARRDVDKSIVFEVSSKLLERQMCPYGARKFACRSKALQPLFLQCVRISKDLEACGVRWEIRHIYSEYNNLAESLARRAALLGNSEWS